jgi:hypothetical protein
VWVDGLVDNGRDHFDLAERWCRLADRNVHQPWMGPRRGELAPAPGNGSIVRSADAKSGARNDAHDILTPPRPELQEIIEFWPARPADRHAAILAIGQGAASSPAEQQAEATSHTMTEPMAGVTLGVPVASEYQSDRTNSEAECNDDPHGPSDSCPPSGDSDRQLQRHGFKPARLDSHRLFRRSTLGSRRIRPEFRCTSHLSFGCVASTRGGAPFTQSAIFAICDDSTDSLFSHSVLRAKVRTDIVSVWVLAGC